MTCPLCADPRSSLYDVDKFRNYLFCPRCTLVYVPRESILSFEEEAARYEAHENDEDSLEYHQYLSQTAMAIIPKLPPRAKGLDFGCGKTVVLEKIFKGHGFEVESYDLYFHPHQDIWHKTYDFVVLSEVIEHLSGPAKVMLGLSRLLKKDGKIFVKTKLLPVDTGSFRNWFYKRDLTHVQFFSSESLTKLGELMGLAGPFPCAAPDLYEFQMTAPPLPSLL